MTKVSVIIPCYNAGRFLTECLDSILAQTLKEIEVICINDGSTDNTLDILNNYFKKDPRIIIINQSNKFAGAARNAGMSQATGKYLSFLDADDFFEPTMLEKMYSKCEEDNADICICEYLNYDMRTQSILNTPTSPIKHIPEYTPFSAIHIPKDIYKICNIAPWTKMFKSSFIKTHGLQFQAIKRANDIFLGYAALAVAERITVCKQYLVYHRVRSSTSLVETMDDNPLCFYQAVSELKNFLIQQKLYKILEESFLYVCAGVAVHALIMVKTHEAWLKIALFIKEQYIPEFGLQASKNPDILFLMTTDRNTLLAYKPELRQDETAAKKHSRIWRLPLIRLIIKTGGKILKPLTGKLPWLHRLRSKLLQRLR